ncbi:hypothetical protein PtB15_5B63 [Puccinia triticina]|nr:hypothetical protein PtB15_5B63 [Puccinia triticina]
MSCPAIFAKDPINCKNNPLTSSHLPSSTTMLLGKTSPSNPMVNHQRTSTLPRPSPTSLLPSPLNKILPKTVELTFQEIARVSPPPPPTSDNKAKRDR